MHKLILVACIIGLSGCVTTQGQQGAVKGGAAGAIGGGLLGTVIGGATGSDNKGRDAAIGAAIGGVLGAVIGQRMNQQTEELEQVQGVENVNYDERQQTIDAKMQIFFDVDKAEVKYTEAPKLDQLASVFSKYPENIVVIEGHTDSDGSDAYNQNLSERRAQAIELYLRRKNLNIASLSSVGYGESRPIASNATAAGKAQNRRVEIKISVDPNRVPQQSQQRYPQQQPSTHPATYPALAPRGY
jgi:outer membrane protein OmpA-like peptidoglycan-associated protein